MKGYKCFLEKENFEDKVKEASNEDDLLKDNFEIDSGPSLDITCNMVSFILREYNQITEIEELKEKIDAEMTRHRPVSDYVINYGCIEEKNTFFERPDATMKGVRPIVLCNYKYQGVRLIRELE